MFFIDKNGDVYAGECADGDRVASSEEVASWQSAREKFIRRAEILAQLAEIDRRSIRPIAEGDVEFLTQLRAPVNALRTELQSLE